MKISPIDIQIIESKKDIIVDGKIAVFNGKVQIANIPTKAIKIRTGFKTLTEVVEVKKFIGVKDLDTNIFIPIDKLTNNPKNYENQYSIEFLKIEVENEKEPIIETIAILDLELNGFEYGLPNNESTSYIKKEVNFQQVKVNFTRYYRELEININRLFIEKGRYAYATDTKNTWYCDGKQWINTTNIKRSKRI